MENKQVIVELIKESSTPEKAADKILDFFFDLSIDYRDEISDKGVKMIRASKHIFIDGDFLSGFYCGVQNYRKQITSISEKNHLFSR